MELITTPSPRVLSSASENESCPDISLRASYLTIPTSRSARGSTVPCDPTAPCTSAAHSRTDWAARLLALSPTATPSTPNNTPTAAITIVVTVSTIAVTLGGGHRAPQHEAKGPFGRKDFQIIISNGPLLRVIGHPPRHQGGASAQPRRQRQADIRE